MTFRRPLLDLLLPMRCVCCNSSNGPVCSECEAQLDWAPRRVSRGGFSGVAVIDYSPPSAELISAFKEQAHTTLTSGFSLQMARALELFELPSVMRARGAVLVPVPSHPESTRGYSPAELLAKSLAARTRLPWLRGLGMRSAVRDQAGLAANSRANNLIGAMWAEKWMNRRTVWIVDDLVTTGSTLLEARRALTEVGARVDGFVTFAETLKKNASRNPK